MKKIVVILLSALACCTMFIGCSNSSANQEQHLSVYSFSGEDEQFAISNGVIVLNSTEETFYGGDLKEKQDKLSDIAAYTKTFYVMSGNEKKVLMSFVVEDMTGGTVNISGDIGKISGDIMTKIGTDELQNNLFFELKTTDLNGEKNEYQLQLTVTEVTEKADN